MNFEELCLLTEAQNLMKIASYDDKTKNVGDVASKIISYITRNIRNTDGQMVFYINEPSATQAYLTLVYFNTDFTTETGVLIPANSFKYEIPSPTQHLYRQRAADIFNNTSKNAYIQDRFLVFYIKKFRTTEKIDKIFPAVDLQRILSNLYAAGDYFGASYGSKYNFAGDIYTMGVKTSIRGLIKGLKQSWADTKRIPGDLGAVWTNITNK